MDTLTSMELFVKAVESGSFSATARSMNLTPSAVSKQISRLEDRLGARLFNRTTRQLAPTEEGRAYYERCQQILADIQEAEAAVTELNTEPRGALRVNMPVVFGRRHIVPILGEFLERHPYVSMELSMSDQFVDPIAEGADMLIRVGELKDSSLIARKLAEARRVLRPGGRFLCLEFSQVVLPVLDEIYDRYSFSVLPWLGKRVARDEAAYRYLAESIRQFPDQGAYGALIRDAGLESVRVRNLSGGIAAIHTARRI